MQQHTAIRRHRAALPRTKLSRPVVRGIEAGYITRSRTIFDYGCGYGGDAERLVEQEYPVVSRYDPFYFPNEEIIPADIVLLSFVLSTIENKAEREQVLARAYDLAQEYLIVSFLVDPRLPQKGIPYGDGYLTRYRTFEKSYSSLECVEYLQAVLGIVYLDKLDQGIYVVPKVRHQPLLAYNCNEGEQKRWLNNLRKQRQRLRNEPIAPPGAYLEAYECQGEQRFRLRSPQRNLQRSDGCMVKMLDLGDGSGSDYREAEKAIERRDKLEIVRSRILYLKRAMAEQMPASIPIKIAPPPQWIPELLQHHHKVSH